MCLPHRGLETATSLVRMLARGPRKATGSGTMGRHRSSDELCSSAIPALLDRFGRLPFRKVHVKRSALTLVLIAVCAACARSAPTPSVGPRSSDVDVRRVGIYEEAFRSLYATEGWYTPVILDERICIGGSPGTQPDGTCPDRFSAVEQQAILEALSDLPHVGFTNDAASVARQIFHDDIHDAGLLSVGPISGTGDRVEVQAASTAAGLAANG